MSKATPIFFLIIAIGLLIFISQKMPSSPLFSNKGSVPSRTTPVPTAVGTANPYSGIRPETVIVSGPQPGAVIDNDRKVTFYYATIWPGDVTNISFETRVSGLDSDWQTSYSNSRTINFGSGDKNYIFQVRAKTSDGIYDLTPAERAFRVKISSYLDKVKISSVSPGQYPYSIMRITLTNQITAINLTGWTLTSNTVKYSIPTAANIYNPSSSQADSVNLKNGDSLIVLGQPSPINANYHFNKCLGYLNSSPSPTPSPNFYNNCPRPDQSEITNLNISCQDFISRLANCQIPKTLDYEDYNIDSACLNFMNNRLNYNGCVQRYRYDSDFFSREWYVYSGNNFLLPDHDKLILRDNAGLLVDVYSY